MLQGDHNGSTPGARAAAVVASSGDDYDDAGELTVGAETRAAMARTLSSHGNLSASGSMSSTARIRGSPTTGSPPRLAPLRVATDGSASPGASVTSGQSTRSTGWGRAAARVVATSEGASEISLGLTSPSCNGSSPGGVPEAKSGAKAFSSRQRLVGAMESVREKVQVRRRYMVDDVGDTQHAALKRAGGSTLSTPPDTPMSIARLAAQAAHAKRLEDNKKLSVRYAQCTGRFKEAVTATKWFQNTITAAIFVAGFNVGAQTYDLSEGALENLEALDTIVLALFTIEVALKVFAEGLRPWRYFKDSWNMFDFLVVAASYMPFDTSQVAMLRLMRLLRLLKLVRALPKLRILVISLLQSAGAVGYVMLMVMLLFYLWAVVGVLFFADNDPVNFGTLHAALLGLWRAATGDDWTDQMYVAIYGCNTQIYGGGADYGSNPEKCINPSPLGMLFPVFYFVAFQVLAGMMLINMFIGAIMMSMQEAQDDLNASATLYIKLWKGDDFVPADFSIAQMLGREDKSTATSDPFVIFSVGDGEDAIQARSRVEHNTLDPVWNQTIVMPKYDPEIHKVLTMKCMDWDRFGADDHLGHAKINLDALPFNKVVRFEVNLVGVPHGTLHITLRKQRETFGIPDDPVDPTSALQTVANRIAKARERLELLTDLAEQKRAADRAAAKLSRGRSLISLGRSVRSLARSVGESLTPTGRRSRAASSASQLTDHAQSVSGIRMRMASFFSYSWRDDRTQASPAGSQVHPEATPPVFSGDARAPSDTDGRPMALNGIPMVASSDDSDDDTATPAAASVGGRIPRASSEASYRRSSPV